MFGPIPAKHLTLSDPRSPKPGLRIAVEGLVLTVDHNGNLFDVPLSGGMPFHGEPTTRQSRGISLKDAEISVVGIVPTESAGAGELGLVAVLDGVIAVSIEVRPWTDRGPTFAMLVDVVTGVPVPLSGPEEALWFQEWALTARFPGEDAFRVGSSSPGK
jgi:hypothetical protein